MKNNINKSVNINNIFKLVKEFKYVEIANIIKNLKTNKYLFFNVNIFLLPYLLVKLEKYDEAYFEIEKISKYLKGNNENLLFVISEFNRKVIGRKLTWNFQYKHNFKEKYGEDCFNKIEESLSNINIEYIIDNYLTHDEKSLIEKKLNNKEAEKYRDKISEISDSLGKNTLYSGGINLIHRKLYDDYILNFIFIENVFPYKKLFYESIKVMLEDIKVLEKRKEFDSSDFFFSINETEKRTINYTDLYIMIENLSPNELSDVLIMKDIEYIELTEEVDSNNTKEILLNAYSNLIDSIMHLNLISCLTHMDNHFLNYINNFFVLFSVIELTSDEFANIIEKYFNFLNSYDYYPDNDRLLKYFTDFITKQFNNEDFRKNINIKFLEKILILICKKTVKDLSKFRFLKREVYRLIRNATVIIDKLDKNFQIKNIKLGDNVSIEILENFYLPMYNFFNKNTKLQIKIRTKNFLDKHFSLDLYHMACFNDVLISTDEYEQKVFNEVKQRIDIYNKLRVNPKTQEIDGKIYKTIPDHEKRAAQNGINMISDLVNFGKIRNIELFKNLTIENKAFSDSYFKFLCDMKNFNYEDFEVDFIHYLTIETSNELRKIISDNKNVKDIIKRKIANAISLKKYNNKYTKDKIFHILFGEPYNFE